MYKENTLFLTEAIPLTLLTRTTLSWDNHIYQRQLIKPSWPLDSITRRSSWLQAYSTKATFSPLIALQVLGEITQRASLLEIVNLSLEARDFIKNICRADLGNIDIMNSEIIPIFLSNHVKLPSDFIVAKEDLLAEEDPGFLAEMQIYALKRGLPLEMIEEGTLIEKISIEPETQILLVNWHHLHHVDLRGMKPSQEMLEALAEAITKLPNTKGFQSFRFKYYHENAEEHPSEDYALAGKKVLKALAGRKDYERPIEELEIDGLHLTSEDEVASLSRIISKCRLRHLTLTRLVSNVDLGVLLEFFLSDNNLADQLKKIKLSLDETSQKRTVSGFFRYFEEMSELQDLILSHNHIGSVLGFHMMECRPNPLARLIKQAKASLNYLDLSDNELFTGQRNNMKFRIFDAIRARRGLIVDLRKNGLRPDEEIISYDLSVWKQEFLYRNLKNELERIFIRFERSDEKITSLREAIERRRMKSFYTSEQEGILGITRTSKRLAGNLTYQLQSEIQNLTGEAIKSLTEIITQQIKNTIEQEDAADLRKITEALKDYFTKKRTESLTNNEFEEIFSTIDATQFPEEGFVERYLSDKGW